LIRSFKYFISTTYNPTSLRESDQFQKNYFPKIVLKKIKINKNPTNEIIGLDNPLAPPLLSNSEGHQIPHRAGTTFNFYFPSLYFKIFVSFIFSRVGS
jgi:hypothetical protein